MYIKGNAIGHVQFLGTDKKPLAKMSLRTFMYTRILLTIVD